MGLIRLLRGFARAEAGAAGVVVAACMIALLGTAALATDLGILYAAQLKLQAATDEAALAGAQNINVGAGGTAISTATTYSATPGNKNAPNNFTATMASGYPLLKCLTSIHVSCSGPDSANAIVVRQNGVVPSFFAKVFGYQSFNITATATATGKGGSQTPLDVMIVLDTVGGNSLLSTNLTDPVSLASPASLADLPNAPCRMNASPTNSLLTYVQDLLFNQCAGGSSGSKISNARAGIRTFLADMMPCSSGLSTCGAATSGNVGSPAAEVGLMVFPGLTNSSQAQYDYETSPNCSTATTPAMTAYYSSPVYEVVPLSSDYRTSDSTTSLNSSSNLALAAGAGSGCGVWAVNPPSLQLLYGSFYADAITAAQTALTNEGRSGSRKVIIFLSDGNADALSELATVTVTAGGSGYTAGANVTFSGGMGSGATGVANVVGGVVTSIMMTNKGSGYSAAGPPTVIITPKNAILGLGGSGTGALATVTLNPGVNQCHQAIAAAQAATAAGTQVYSIAYGASTFPLLTCLTDILPQPTYLIPLIAACTTMQDIASDATKFYSVNFNNSACTSSNNSESDMPSIFAAIASDMSGARLLPNNTT